MDVLSAFSTFDLIPDFVTRSMLLMAGSRADTEIWSDETCRLAGQA